MIPQSEHAEQAVLGCIVGYSEQVMPTIVQQVTPKWFVQPAHATIYAAMLAMWQEGRRIDSITLASQLENKGMLAAIGGVPKIMELYLYVPSAVLLDDYVALLREKFLARAIVSTCATYQQRATDNDDPESLLSEMQADVLAIGEAQFKRMPSTKELLLDVVEDLEKAYLSKGECVGLPTGLLDLDKQMGWMRPEQLVIIAADTAQGKTTLALNIVEHLAVEMKKPCGIVSLEMSGKELLSRVVASVSRVDLHKFASGEASEQDFTRITAANDRIAAAPIFIRDDADVDAIKLRGIGRQLRHENKIELLVVDYVQLLTPVGVKDDNRERAMATAAHALKQMAKELGIVVIALSQVNEHGKLRESRAIGHHADKVLTIKHDPDEPGVAFIHIDKNRSGPTGSVAVTFLGHLTRFANRKAA